MSRAAWGLFLLLSAGCLADSESFWGIRAGMTRGEVEQKLGPPNEVSREGLVYYGGAALPPGGYPIPVTMTAFLDSFYSSGRVTRVQVRSAAGEPNVVAGRVWAPAPLRWAPEAVHPKAGETLWLDDRTTVTDSSGGFAFSNVTTGEHVLRSADYRETLEGVASEQQWVELGAEGPIWIGASAEAGDVRAEAGLLDVGPRRLPFWWATVSFVPQGTLLDVGSSYRMDPPTSYRLELTNLGAQPVTRCEVQLHLENSRDGLTFTNSWAGALAPGERADLSGSQPCPFEPTNLSVKLLSVTFADGRTWKP